LRSGFFRWGASAGFVSAPAPPPSDGFGRVGRRVSAHFRFQRRDHRRQRITQFAHIIKKDSVFHRQWEAHSIVVIDTRRLSTPRLNQSTTAASLTAIASNCLTSKG
jgi:hypothetical protein